MSDKIIASIRVAVASFVGMVLTRLAEYTGFVIDTETSQEIINWFQMGATILFYIFTRIVSAKFPWVELLLGIPAQPTGYMFKGMTDGRR